MRLGARLDRLEHIAPAPVAMPADPPTQALEIMLMALDRRELPIPPEHADMPQVVARELLDRDDASPEGRETALRFLAGEYD